MTPCPNCGRLLPGPACVRAHVAAAHSAAAHEAAREAVRTGSSSR